ncbi:MAG: multidrug effflux MFS transporter [Kofleriaceae bacterium]|nr:multidrug effflux MFS transporter [Kofleriaceae bacterium]
MSSSRAALRIGSRAWTLTLAGLTALVAMSIDASLPAQPELARVFDVADETAQLSLSLFMGGYAVSQIIVGYLSDALGRRVVLTAGLALFTLAGIACTFATSIEMLLVARVVQGVGGAAGPVIARAMVRDTQPHDQAARHLSTMLAAMAIAPMVAPSLGGVLLAHIGWRAVFASLVIAGVLLFGWTQRTLTETLSVERRVTGSLRGLVRGYVQLVRTRGVWLPLSIVCVTFAGQFAFIGSSPLVLIEGYGVPADRFGLYFSTVAIALMVGSIAGSRMLRAGRSPTAVVVGGASIVLAGAIGVSLGTRAGWLGIPGLLVPMCIYFLGAGMVAPSAGALALAPVPHIAGTASAALGFLQMIAGAVAGYVATKVGGSDPTLFATIATVMGALTWGLAGLLAAAHRRAGALS